MMCSEWRVESWMWNFPLHRAPHATRRISQSDRTESWMWNFPLHRWFVDEVYLDLVDIFLTAA